MNCYAIFKFIVSNTISRKFNIFSNSIELTHLLKKIRH